MPGATAGLLHSLGPGHGPWAVVVEVGLFVALLVAAFGVVLVSEDGLEGAQRWSWTAIVLLVPVLGTLAYLSLRRFEPEDTADR